MTLYRETICEHGYVGGHPTTKWHEWFSPDDLIGCLGGSREEVTIDYEAAERIVFPGGAKQPEFVRAIVDAALGE